jgi:hypothetical protein
MKEPQTLGQLAELVRSKNAGPFWITLDVFFGSEANYERAASSGNITPDTIASLYHVPASTIKIFRLPLRHAIKVSFPRPHVQGSFADRDMHSGQQQLLLASLPIGDQG